MRIDYDDGLSVRWTPREYAKIVEISNRPDRRHQLGCKWGNHQYIRDLWHYYDYFFHREVTVTDDGLERKGGQER